MWYGIILSIGVILLLSGLYKLNASINFIKHGNRITAVVVELESYRDNDGDVLYRPVFQYRLDREQQKFVYRVGSKPAAWKIGEEATLITAPGDPGNVMLLTYFGAFGWTIVLVAIALPMISIGGGYFWAIHFLQKTAETSL